jgi:hypothetical protein
MSRDIVDRNHATFQFETLLAFSHYAASMGEIENLALAITFTYFSVLV